MMITSNTTHTHIHSFSIRLVKQFWSYSLIFYHFLPFFLFFFLNSNCVVCASTGQKYRVISCAYSQIGIKSNASWLINYTLTNIKNKISKISKKNEEERKRSIYFININILCVFNMHTYTHTRLESLLNTYFILFYLSLNHRYIDSPSSLFFVIVSSNCCCFSYDYFSKKKEDANQSLVECQMTQICKKLRDVKTDSPTERER